MNDRLERLVDAVRLTFPLVDDRERAADILEDALRALVARHAAQPFQIDAIGAPVLARQARPADVEWDSLRRAVKLVIERIGLEICAQQFGSSPESLRDIVNRTREPGVGRKARFLALVHDATGQSAVSPPGQRRA